MMRTESNAMKVKRYVAEDMRQGLKMVRDDLGPDAVILSSKRSAEGIEILSTLEYDEAQPFSEFAAEKQAADKQVAHGEPDHPSGQETRPQEQLDSVFEQLLNQHKQHRVTETVDQELMAAMRSEIENLRWLLKDQMEHNREESWGARNPTDASVLKRLQKQGLSSAVAQSIIRSAPIHTTVEESWHAALQGLQDSIKVASKNEFSQGVVALLGPTGAGKTTTMAKLAVRYALRYGRDNLALVTTDCYRIAAYEQLKALARIIDVPVRIVDEHTSLDKVLRSLRHKPMVFVDTAGFNKSEDQRQSQLDELARVKVPVKKLLVLPCTSQAEALSAAYDLVEQSHIDACILSKIDETGRIGELLSLLVEKRLPVAYITNGQSIPDDIEKAKADVLVSQFVGTGYNDSDPMSGLFSSAPPTLASRVQY